jgi:hypothetical protein
MGCVVCALVRLGHLGVGARAVRKLGNAFAGRNSSMTTPWSLGDLLLAEVGSGAGCE